MKSETRIQNPTPPFTKSIIGNFERRGLEKIINKYGMYKPGGMSKYEIEVESDLNINNIVKYDRNADEATIYLGGTSWLSKLNGDGYLFCYRPYEHYSGGDYGYIKIEGNKYKVRGTIRRGAQPLFYLEKHGNVFTLITFSGAHIIVEKDGRRKSFW